MLISGTGYVEPVRIVLKSDRSGLGRDAELKEIAAQKLAIRKRLMHKREKATDTQDYRARITRKAAERQIEGDLRKSQRVCEELDTSKVNISIMDCFNAANASIIQSIYPIEHLMDKEVNCCMCHLLQFYM